MSLVTQSCINASRSAPGLGLAVSAAILAGIVMVFLIVLSARRFVDDARNFVTWAGPTSARRFVDDARNFVTWAGPTVVPLLPALCALGAVASPWKIFNDTIVNINIKFTYMTYKSYAI
jgi:hypothetical protein